MREERERGDGDLTLATVESAEHERAMNRPPLQERDATRRLFWGQRLLVQRPWLEELLPARHRQLADVEIWAPQHLAGCIVEEDEVPPRIRDERRRCELRREGTGDDQDQVRLFAFHAPDPTQLLVRLGFPPVAKVAPDEHELRRVIDEEREIDGLGSDELLAIYRSLVLLRTYDERSLVYHRQGRIGTYAIFWNHEAMQAGAVHALADEDWIFPSYRESAIGLLRGMPAATVLHWWRGHPAGWWNPADYNLASICVPIATQVPHAAGLAWGKKLKGECALALTFFGDGATSEGAFHEGANFAAVMQAPLILFCNNNQWAISTPITAQTHAEALVDKAAGYGMPGIRVDGGDVLAVYEATREGVERARGGGGPTFIEAVTYRTAPHATADDPRAYIDSSRADQEIRNKCLGRNAGYLRRLRILGDELDAATRNEAAAAMR